MTMHFSVRLYFCMHHRVNLPGGGGGGGGGTAMSYGTLNFEALFSGLFLEQQAASAYSELFGAAITPTSPMVLKNNAERLIAIGRRAVRVDNMPRALRVATLVLLLRGDVGWLGEDERGDNVPDWQGSDAAARENAFLDRLRMTNTSAEWLANLAEEASVLKGMSSDPWRYSARRRTRWRWRVI